MAGRITRLSPTPRAVDAVSRLLRRPAVLSRLSDADSVATAGGHSAVDHRIAVVCRARVLVQVSVGADRRSRAVAVPDEMAWPPQKLDVACADTHRDLHIQHVAGRSEGRRVVDC